MPETDPVPDPAPRIDWESFYRSYRKPGYIQGYEILTKLGAGAFGIVFKARKESIGKDYAIKFLKIDDENVRDAVLRELDSVRYFAQVDHPNLVSVEDKGEVDGVPYIIMAHAGDETLRKRMDGGGLPRDEALRIFVQVGRAVQALHDRSLVHFDLKPANVYLKGDIARLGDYGLSKLVSQSRNSLSFGRGTPYYTAPEMLRRRGDHLSDVYSLGVLLFEMSVGRPPFTGDSEWEVLRKHEREPLRIPDHVPAPERRVIRRCLEKVPADRYASVQDLLADLLSEPSTVAGHGAGHGAAPGTAAGATGAAGAAGAEHAAESAERAADVVAAVAAAAVEQSARAHAIRAEPIRTPGWRCGSSRRRNGAHEFPAYSGRKFAVLTALICAAVFVFLALFWSVSSMRFARADAERHAWRAAMSVARARAEPVRATMPPVPLADETSRSTRRKVEGYVRALRKERNASSTARKLASFGRHAVPVIVNELLRLNLIDAGEAAYAARLDAVLASITGYSSGFVAVGRSIQPWQADDNVRAIDRWRDYWLEHKDDCSWLGR